jgi:uncharacterized protein involved in response to NO
MGVIVLGEAALLSPLVSRVVVEGVTPVFWPLLVVLCAKPVLAPSNKKNVQVHLIASVITHS